MKILSAILLLATIPLHAGETQTPFRHPYGFPVKMRLVLPDKDADIISHRTQDGWDTITARLENDRSGGMQVEAVDPSGKEVWRHDFGYDASAAPGCRVSISHHPRLSAVIVKFEGHKWNWHTKLLFIKSSATGPLVREYEADGQVLSAFLKKQPGYSPRHRYAISPARFSGNDIVFSCTPGTVADDAHPLAQDLPWFEIKAGIDANFGVSPISAAVVHSPAER